MENKKLFTLIISILMILTIPFIMYGYNFNSIAFDKDFYKKEFSKYNVYESLGNYDIESINNDVLNYLENGKNDNLIENDFFNEREKIHLLDVKNLISKVLLIYYVSIVLFLLLFILLIFLLNFNFKLIIKRLLIILTIGSLLTLLDAILFFILSNFSFNFVFYLFHKIFFSVGTYTFDPAYENIVVLYPENLFFDALIRILTNTILTSITILFFCAIILFFLKTSFFEIFFKKYRREK